MVGSVVRWLLGRKRELAPSLYDVLPNASSAPRTLPRAEIVPAADIAGTTRHPSNTTADFLPIPALRSAHWRQNFGRMLLAQEHLVALPPVQLMKVDDRYFVVDGHKRVAAARRVSGVLDAIVVELRPYSPLASATNCYDGRLA
jgi:hypothetical protein